MIFDRKKIMATTQNIKDSTSQKVLFFSQESLTRLACNRPILLDLFIVDKYIRLRIRRACYVFN